MDLYLECPPGDNEFIKEVKNSFGEENVQVILQYSFSTVETVMLIISIAQLSIEAVNLISELSRFKKNIRDQNKEKSEDDKKTKRYILLMDGSQIFENYTINETVEIMKQIKTK